MRRRMSRYRSRSPPSDTGGPTIDSRLVRTILSKVICAFSDSPREKEGRTMAQAIGRELGTADVWAQF